MSSSSEPEPLPPESKMGASPILERLPDSLHKAARFLTGQGAREGYLSAVDQGVISLANFIATIILARNVSPTELGVYGVGFTALRLVRAIQEGITIQPLNTFGAAMGEDDFRKYARATTVLQVILALVSAIIVAFTGWILIRTGNDTAGPAVFSLWSAFLWWQLQEYLRRMLYTRGAVFHAVVNTAIANGTRLLLMLYWVSQGTLSGINGLEAIGIGSLFALLPGLWQTRRYLFYPKKGRPALPEVPGDTSAGNRDISAAQTPLLGVPYPTDFSLIGVWKQNWSFGRFMLGATISSWVSVEFYPVLTAGMISFAAAGAYRAIQNLVQPVQLLLRALDTFLTPRAAKTYHEQGLPALGGLLRKAYLVFGAPILGLLGLAVVLREPLLRLLYGETYLPYANGVFLMAIFYGLWFAYMPLQTVLKATQTSRPIFIANLVAIAVMFTLGIWLILSFGVYGTMLGQAVNALVVLLISWAAWRALQKTAYP